MWRRFTLADLSGSYALTISGGRTQDVGQIAGVGVLHSDGKGNVSVTVSFQALAATCSGTTNGTYVVNPDGTGSISLPAIQSFSGSDGICHTISPVFTLSLTSWNLVFDSNFGNQLDLSHEDILGKLSRQ